MFQIQFYVKMIELIKTNIPWIKDLFTLVLAGTAIVISILTYKRARATILQPMRSEVIKRQSEILSNLLQFLPHNLADLLKKVDYYGIVRVSSFSILDEYGFRLEDHEKIMKESTKNVVGFIYCGESDIIESVEKIQTFNSPRQKTEEKPYGKILYERAKQGIINIDCIHITTKYKNFMEELSNYANSPFLPQKIQLILKKLIRDIYANLSIHIKESLQEFMKEFCKRHFTKEKIGKISPDGIYNNFNEKRIDHTNDLKQLNLEIRKYLMIDEKW